jgi:hypothetical protein
MSTHDDAFTAEAKSLVYTFRAKAGTKPTWTPRWGFVTDEPHYDPRFQIGGQFGGWFYGVRAYGGHGWEFGAATKRGPEVNEYSDFAGVLGTGVYVTGVAGTSINNVGVYGQTGEVSELPWPVPNFYARAGVLGAAEQGSGVFGVSAFGAGVSGFCPKGTAVEGFSTYGIGVVGSAREFPGVYGVSGTAPAVYGLASSDSGVLGICDTEGPPPQMPNLPNVAGVIGSADQRAGVIGTSNASIGVYGFSTGNAGVVGESVSSFAGYFGGNVQITGNLTVNGMISPNPKLAVVLFPDGTHRALYCMESPEVWFEDFGIARLKRGRAVVKIDADFVKLIKRGGYRVFLTPEGDCRGLYARRKANSFEVRELMGGKSSIAFAYRIVGRREDIKGYTRFAKVDPRIAKIDTRLAPTAAARRAPRKGAPKSSALRTFLTRLEKAKETWQRRPKGMKKGSGSRPLPKYVKRAMRP